MYRILHLLKLMLVQILIALPVLLAAQPQYFDQLDLLEGKRKAVIPFKYVHNFIIIEAKIYGLLPVQFIFDTGAEHVILFKKEYTDLLQVTYDKRIPILGSDLSQEVYALIARNGVIEVNGLPPKPHDLLVLEQDYFDLDEMIGTQVAGLIGGGFFRNLVVRIDYRKHQIQLFDPRSFEAPDGYTNIPVRIKTNKPYVNAEASLMDGTVVQVDLLVDTGAGVPLLLHTNSHPSLHVPEQFIKGRLGLGLGGYLEGYVGRINKLAVGDFRFPGVLTSFQDVEESWLSDPEKFRNGILGNELLSRFDVYFDYNHGQMLLRPYRKHQQEFTMDRSGLVLFAYGPDFNRFVVREIIDGSPAADADFHTDDMILKIRGTSAKYFTLDAINQILQKRPGTRIKMVVQRGQEMLHKEITLRDLI